MITSYFNSIFTSQQGRNTDIVEKVLTPSILEETNINLIHDPSPKEIKEAMFSIHADKAPWPDGFSASFFQSNWQTVGPFQEIQEFYISGVIPRTINITHIRLIPKVSSSKVVSDYRPIALCNVYYKVIEKIPTRRLQLVLKRLVSENQSAFVQRRAIADNVLSTHKVLHFLKTSTVEKRCSMAG